jgi:hypothetical protein
MVAKITTGGQASTACNRQPHCGRATLPFGVFFTLDATPLGILSDFH